MKKKFLITELQRIICFITVQETDSAGHLKAEKLKDAMDQMVNLVALCQADLLSNKRHH